MPVPNALPSHPRLKATVEVFPASDRTIYLLRGGTEPDFALEETPAARALLELLDGRRATTELAGGLAERGVGASDEAVREAVGALHDAGLVEDARDDDRLSDHERARYERQLRYFGDVAPPEVSRAEYQLRLRDARVVVIGLGGLGSWVALALACCGVGRIDGIDGDVVEVSNFNRQVLFRDSDLGRPKAEAAARSIRAFNPSIHFEPLVARLEGPADVEAAVEGADFVVDAADWPVHEIERWVNEACFGLGVPYLTMSQSPPLARLGPTYVPGTTACFACREATYRRDFPLFDELVDLRRRLPSPAATFGPACGLIGSQAATDVVHHLTGIAEPATLAAALMIDLRTMEITREPVERIPGCPICS